MKKGVGTKIKALLLALTMATCSFVCNPGEVKAATSLGFNQIYDFALTCGTYQSFTFQTPASGYFRVEAALTDVKSRSGKSEYGNNMILSLSVDNESLAVSHLGRSTGAISTKEFAFAPGKTATISVSAPVSGQWTYYYKIQVVNETPANFEKEDNNTLATAEKVKAKKVYKGIINKRGDDDCFVFKAPKTGNYRLYIQSTDDPRSCNFFYLEGFKSKNKKDPKLSFVSIHAGRGWGKSQKIKLKKGKKYYIRVGNPLYSNAHYEFKFKKVK